MQTGRSRRVTPKVKFSPFMISFPNCLALPLLELKARNSMAPFLLKLPMTFLTQSPSSSSSVSFSISPLTLAVFPPMKNSFPLKQIIWITEIWRLSVYQTLTATMRRSPRGRLAMRGWSSKLTWSGRSLPLMMERVPPSRCSGAASPSSSSSSFMRNSMLPMTSCRQRSRLQWRVSSCLSAFSSSCLRVSLSSRAVFLSLSAFSILRWQSSCFSLRVRSSSKASFISHLAGWYCGSSLRFLVGSGWQFLLAQLLMSGRQSPLSSLHLRSSWNMYSWSMRSLCVFLRSTLWSVLSLFLSFSTSDLSSLSSRLLSSFSAFLIMTAWFLSMFLTASMSLLAWAIWESTSMSLPSTSFSTSSLLVHSLVFSSSTSFLYRATCRQAFSSSLRSAGRALSASPSSFSFLRSSNFFLPSLVVSSLLILMSSRRSLSFLAFSSLSRWSWLALRFVSSRLCGLVRLRCMVSCFEGEEGSRESGATGCGGGGAMGGGGGGRSEGGSMRRDMREPSSKEQLLREQRVGFDSLRVPWGSFPINKIQATQMQPHSPLACQSLLPASSAGHLPALCLESISIYYFWRVVYCAGWVLLCASFDMSQRQKAQQYLQGIRAGFENMRKVLVSRFENDNSSIFTNHSELRGLIYHFAEQGKPITKEKVEINKFVRENIQIFIHDYIAKKLTPLEKISKDPHQFVLTLNEVWTHFQIYVFCHFFVCEKVTEFFTNFFKMNNCRDYEYRCSKSKGNEEIAPIPVMGVNELRRYFEEIRLIERFKSVFNSFLQFEREGKNVPREEIRESVHSLESCYFDMDAFAILEEEKPRIIKREFRNEKMPLFRKSKDGEFFSDHLLEDTLANLNKFYEKWVQEKAVDMNSTDEIRRLLEIIDEEERRADYYIHSKENCAKYVAVLNKALIDNRLELRIKKEDGFRRYVELYEEGKEEYEREIRGYWAIYSRVLERSLPFTRDTFNSYLQVEAEKLVDKTKKPPDFIAELIRINGKCIRIVDFCANNFELENDRNTKIRGMLSNDLTERGKKEAKFDIGAKNLASFMNNKFKVNYSKGGLEAMGDSYRQLVALFKILQEKTRFIDEEQKYMAARLQEDVEFSKDLETGQIIAMEKNFIEEIQKECGVSEVKELAENIKDLEKSIDINNKLKNKLPANKIFPLNQIIIKNANFWPEKSTYALENPPYLLHQAYNTVSEYFRNNNTNIQFEYNTGVSLFKGEFDNGKKQNFQFKNLYLMVLLFVDEERKLLYGNLKKKIESVGTNKQKGQIELAKVIMELLYSGLLISSTKSIKPGTPNICKILETDEFEINRKYDFVEEEKRKKGAKGPAPKPVPVLKSNILTLSEELKKGFDEEIKAFNEDEKRIEAERKFKVECITVKTLKHAHHHHMNCSFEHLFKVTQEGRNKEFRVTEKFLKEIVEELINKKYCERVEGQRNVFRYIA